MTGRIRSRLAAQLRQGAEAAARRAGQGIDERSERQRCACPRGDAQERSGDERRPTRSRRPVKLRRRIEEDARLRPADAGALRVLRRARATASSSKARKVTRVGAFDLLTRMDEPSVARRCSTPFCRCGQAVNGSERARQSVSPHDQHGGGQSARVGIRDRCRGEDRRRLDRGSRALAGADPRHVATGQRRRRRSSPGTIDTSAARRIARWRRASRASDAADQRALLPRSRRGPEKVGRAVRPRAAARARRRSPTRTTCVADEW